MKMKKTIKMATLKQPHNYWIERRVWVDENLIEYVKINGHYFEIDWLYDKDWEIHITF